MGHDPNPSSNTPTSSRTVVNPTRFASDLRLAQMLLGDMKLIPRSKQCEQIDTACRVLFAVHALNTNRQLVKTLRNVLHLSKVNAPPGVEADVAWLEERLKILVPTL